MKNVLTVLLLLMSVSFVYAQGKVTNSIVNNGDQYLNVSKFKEAFKAHIGGKTGNDIYVVVNDRYVGTNHGNEMSDIVNLIKVSDDIKLIKRNVDEATIDCVENNKKVKCELNREVEKLLRKNNVRVWNESNGVPVMARVKADIDYATIINQFKKLLKQYGIMYVSSSGNNENKLSTRNIKNLINNPLDNLLTVAQFGISSKNGKPKMENGMFFRAPDFSVFGNYEVADGKELSGWAGTSPAAAVTSAIIAQYYSIMPCWSTIDMKRFINATLKPAKDIGLEDKWTKTKKYLSYSEKIFDKNFLRSHNIKVCGN